MRIHDPTLCNMALSRSLNICIAFKGTYLKFIFSFSTTAAGVVSCGGLKRSLMRIHQYGPRCTSTTLLNLIDIYFRNNRYNLIKLSPVNN